MKQTADRPRRARAGTYTITDGAGGAAPIEVVVTLSPRHPAPAAPVRRRIPASCATIGAVNPLDLVAVALLIVVGAVLGFRSGAMPQIGGLLGAIGGGGSRSSLALPSSPTRWRRSIRRSARSWSSPACSSRSASASRSARRSGRSVDDGASAAGVLERRGPRRRGVRRGRPGRPDRLAGRRPRRARAGAAPDRDRPDVDRRPDPRPVLPPPTSSRSALGRLLDATGLPTCSSGSSPCPQPPVDRRTTRRPGRSPATPRPSTVKVSAATCGLTVDRDGVRRRGRTTS